MTSYHVYQIHLTAMLDFIKTHTFLVAVNVPHICILFSFCVAPVDGFYRGDKLINLKFIAEEALQKCRDK